MTSKKRRRPAADDPAQAISLHGYHLLPSELQHHIIHLACLPTPNDSRSLFPVDRTTLLRLCLVSRSFNRVATGKLYRNVVITQPSALYPLYQTLTARPSLAALVKSFHIGPTSALSPHWWPLTFAYPDGQGWDSVKNGHEGVPYHWMSSSLEAARLPLGCQDRQAWVYDRAATGCREAAVHEALSVAQRSLNVDLAVPQHGPLPPGSLWRPNIGQIWASRVFEAQAALDLYLEEVRAVEEADPKLLARQTRPGARVPAPCRNGKCGCYPALYITGVSTPPPSGAFKVSRAQLLHHIARRGALTDHFDHPLVFIRSSLGVIIHQPPGKGFRHYSPAFTCARYELYSDRWDSDSLHASHHCADFAFLREKDAYSWPGKVTDAGRFSTATFDSTLRLTQGLLGLLPCLENLSLTGYLEKTLDGWTAKEKSRLRRLSLGPTPETWKPQLHLDSLSGLEQLRICDVPLRAHDIVRINQMKRLRQLAWTMTGRYPPDMGTSLLQAILLLVGYEEQPSSTQGRGPVSSISEVVTSWQASAQDSPQRNSHNPEEGGHLPVIKATLHPDDVSQLLSAAPTEQMREEWAGGRTPAAGGLRQLHLTAAHDAALDVMSSGGAGQQHSADGGSSRDGAYEELESWWHGFVG